MKNFSDNLIPSFFRVFLFSALAGIFLGGSGVFAQGKIIINISPEVTIASGQVALGDIAEILGGGANGADTFERVRHISLGYSPRIGAMREIQRANILLALAAAGFNESDLTLDIPAKVVVRRATQTLSQNLLREVVEKTILPQFAAENVSTRITKLELPEALELPTGNVEVRVVGFAGITNFREPTMISLELRVDGKVLRRVPANIEIEVIADVLVLARNGIAGAKLIESDVRTEKIRLERSLSSYLRTPADLAGKKLLKNLSGSSPLTTDAVAADMVIKSGDTVSIVARSGSAQISVTGEARASGRIGDRIAVKNTQSGIILQAQIVEQGLVKLNF
jgi:flagella basal body P-ring formation protein FlgA